MDSYIVFRKEKRVVVREGDMTVDKLCRIFQVSAIACVQHCPNQSRSDLCRPLVDEFRSLSQRPPPRHLDSVPSTSRPYPALLIENYGSAPIYEVSYMQCNACMKRSKYRCETLACANLLPCLPPPVCCAQ